MNISEVMKVIAPLCDSEAHARKVMREVFLAMGLDLEWALAELDTDGEIVQVGHEDRHIGSVLRSLRENDGGSVRLASRVSSPWEISN